MTNSSAAAGTSPDLALLEEGLARLGLGAAVMDTVVKLLTRYIEEIELFNPAYGLVKVRDRRELIVKHILDSLAPLNILCRLLEPAAEPGPQGKPRAWRVADVGSGAGLPGIPLAVCMSGVEFTLIERMGRRAGFLRNAVAVLGLSNVRVEETEMEKITQAGCFDLVVFRAFRPLEPVILKGLLRLLAPGGIIAAYKGRRESLEEEMVIASEKSAGITAAGWESLSWEVFPLEVPFLDNERHLLLIRQGIGIDSE